MPTPKSQQSWVRSQYPPTLWNLRGGSVEYKEERNPKKSPRKKMFLIRIHCIRIKIRAFCCVAIRMPKWILFKPTRYCRSNEDVRVTLGGVCLFHRWPTRKLEQDFLRCVRDKLPGDGFPKTEALSARNQAFLVRLGGGGGGRRYICTETRKIPDIACVFLRCTF